ncbi:MAG: hypothetical protein ACJAT9_001794 [Polaribacter sp.]|jgi:hypothetical protein
MKKITLLFTICAFLTANVINAQTVIWSSDLDDTTGWSSSDNDEDGQNWNFYSGGADSYGMTGSFAASESWNGTVGPLNPDNRLYTPVVAIPAQALEIAYKMKVVSPDPTWFDEKFAIYAYDSDGDGSDLTEIHSESLTVGGVGTAKDVSIVVPDSFAGKNVQFIVRHFDCPDRNSIFIDDFEVSYASTLSTEDNITEKISVYPNSVKDVITINTNKVINSITVVNQLGQTVKVIQEKEILNNTVNLSNLSKGLYFMSIKIENNTQSFKIIKE